MFKAREVLGPSFAKQDKNTFWEAITASHQADEADYLKELIELARPSAQERERTRRIATELVTQVREQDDAVHMIDALLQEYSLDTQEGILLMCLAEALMRIPDKETADALIRDKMSAAQWDRHLGRSESTLVNASTWGLLLTGKVVKLDRNIDGTPSNIWKRLVKRSGEPVIRAAMYRAMAIMGKQFVLGRNIREALENGRRFRDKNYTYSFDMLGEAAMTAEDAARHLDDYRAAIEVVGSDVYPEREGVPKPSISIKLSALHPRYEQAQEERVLTELCETVRGLIRHARERGVAITIDAEETDRLEVSLKLFEKLFRSPECRGWGGFGMVVQAYAKTGLPALCWMTKLAREYGDLIPVRLVKGAYWDNEIKHSQQLGLSTYPVFTRKEATDTSYLACLRFLMGDDTRGALYPQFASHNAHTVASILSFAEATDRPFEFQRLHGMGDALHNTILDRYKIPVRIYAPVGAHKDLLPYLVRRLLENGANSSFVHRLVDAATPIESLIQEPTDDLTGYASLANDRIPLPPNIYGKTRRNSHGVNLNLSGDFEPLNAAIREWDSHEWEVGSIINGRDVHEGDRKTLFSPYDHSARVGIVHWAGDQQVDAALDVAAEAFKEWNETPAERRARCMEKYGDLLEAHRPELMALCAREAGKTLQDSIDEIREAVDFCRYYALQAREKFSVPQFLPGPTGETNELYLEGRGVFVCISPWNFPLAIFTGQIMAALGAGNTVIAKPAEQTTLLAHRAVELMLEAGFPPGVIQMLAGDGAAIGSRLMPDPRVMGVAFTGSTQTAHIINRTLAAREGAIVPMIAETGGQNAMIVDSTALPEQVIHDVLQSAFASAGQRCSALRVLYLQEDVAERMEEILAGAMRELRVGDPNLLRTDVGPVIDADARQQLQAHLDQLKESAELIAETSLPQETARGNFIAPSAYRIQSIGSLKKENFGPILHVVRYARGRLDEVIEEINQAGYGLTLGIHSRSEATAAYIEKRVKVGNTYVNRNQIGAVVGVQPFGGRGLSGTGPKAGGPHYILRFATERTRTINTTAVGGNATLLSLGVERVS